MHRQTTAPARVQVRVRVRLVVAWCMDRRKQFQKLKKYQSRVLDQSPPSSFRNKHNLTANCELLSSTLA